jgi:pyridoxamine 5'-phosphate oxidase
MNEHLQKFRQEYKRETLSEKNTAADPFLQFSQWFAQAEKAGIEEPNAMALATVSPNGMPAIRMVLLKDIEDEAFVFFTNYHSRKGLHLANNPKASLLFFWKEMERQIRIEGFTEQASPEYSDNYFLSRPELSRIAAIASKQSTVLSSREQLEEEFRKIQSNKNHLEKRPVFWGGYRLMPTLFEFWQGREHRLHDRIQYRKNDGIWMQERLAP